MLLDHRTYTVRPGTLKLQLELYATFGFEAQKRHLGPPLAFLVTETGELNTYVHIWCYADAADRMRRREALQTDADWKVYADKAAAAGYITRQDTKLMTPAFFAPLEMPAAAGDKGKA
jgi:hypothetical protein